MDDKWGTAAWWELWVLVRVPRYVSPIAYGVAGLHERGDGVTEVEHSLRENGLEVTILGAVAPPRPRGVPKCQEDPLVVLVAVEMTPRLAMTGPAGQRVTDTASCQ